MVDGTPTSFMALFTKATASLKVLFGADRNGAESLRSHDKKTLVSAQNLENKGPEIFLPARSMVLKIVRGKILETWELGCFPTAHRCATSASSFEVHWSRSAGEAVQEPRPPSGCQRSVIILQISSAYLCYPK